MTEFECPVCGFEPEGEHAEGKIKYHYEQTDHNPDARE